MRNPCLNSCLLIPIFFFSFFFFFQSSQQLSPPRPNPRLENAYIALQAWKHVITSDPKNQTSNWCGPYVCNYTGVYCAPAPDDPDITTVAGIDLNHANLEGTLPEDLGLLTDLALFHLNSNRFCGTVPESFQNLHLLYELDLSNNQFSGPFPNVTLSLPSLKFFDIRYNKFEGNVPDKLFDLNLDGLFINNNNFRSTVPKNIGNSTASVLVLANNNFNGCFPQGLENLGATLNEIILMNLSITSCLPPEIGKLKNLTVFDVSFNKLVGPLPESIGEMESLQQLNVAHNKLSGEIPASICELPNLLNFTYSYNYLCGEAPSCLDLQDFDDRKNCIPDRPKQRSEKECTAFSSHPVHCDAFGCSASPLTPRRPPPPKYH